MVTGGGSNDTVGPTLNAKRRRRKEQLEEDDSSDLSDESDEDDDSQRYVMECLQSALCSPTTDLPTRSSSPRCRCERAPAHRLCEARHCATSLQMPEKDPHL